MIGDIAGRVSYVEEFVCVNLTLEPEAMLTREKGCTGFCLKCQLFSCRATN